MATKIKWEDADFKWDLAPTDTSAIRYTWDDVTLVEELVVVIAFDTNALEGFTSFLSTAVRVAEISNTALCSVNVKSLF